MPSQDKIFSMNDMQYQYTASDKAIRINYGQAVVGVLLNLTKGTQTILCQKKKNAPDLRVAMVREASNVWSVVYQKRELVNRRGAVSMGKVWKYYPSATSVTLDEAVTKYLDSTTK